MKPDSNACIFNSNEIGDVKIFGLPTVEVGQNRYEELIRKETQLDFLKKLIESRVSYNGYADISDFLVLLDIKKER